MDSFESLIIARRSTRKFADRQIPSECVHKLFQAALLAPSSKNGKPWQFVAVEDKNMLKKLSECKDFGSAFLEECALAVVVSGDKTATDVWVEDASIAATYMQLQAEDLDIGSCWCHIRNRCKDKKSSEKYVRDLLEIPEHYGVLCIIGFGYKNQEHQPKNPSNLTWEKVHINTFRGI